MKSFYLFLLSLIALPTRSEIAFTQLKGLYDPIPEGKKHCSPVHGFNWWKTGIIENFWSFGDQNSDTIKLIRDLFYLQPDGVTFDVTNLARKPAKYFDATTIGKIIALIDPYKKPLTSIEQASLREQLLKTIRQVLNFTQLVTQAEAQIASAKKEVEQFTGLGQERVALQKKILTHERLLKQLANLKPTDTDKVTLTQNRIIETKTEMASTQQQLETIKQRLAQKKNLDRIIHNNDLNDDSLQTLVGYIVGSLQETLQEKYAPYTTHQILLAFLWKKTNEKAAFLNYFTVAVPGMTIENRTQWLQEEYSKDTFSNFYANLETNPELAATNYQLNSFVGFSRRTWNTSGLPLLISSIADATYQIGDQKYHFPDCGETSLRNFFNIRIYNATTGMLDFAILEALGNQNGFTPKPTMASYYKKYGNITKIQTKPYYDAWTQVVSGLPNVEYLNTPDYEISPRNGLSNILSVINNLLFNNSDEFRQMTNRKKLDYVVTKLSNQNFKLTWKAKKLTPQSTTQLVDTEDLSAPITAAEQVNVDTTNVGIRIIFTINGKTHFSWKFTDNHFVLSAPHALLSERTGTVAALLKTASLDATQEMNCINLLCWYVSTKNISAIRQIVGAPMANSDNEPVWDEEKDDWVAPQESQEHETFSYATTNNYLILLGMALDLHNHETLIPLINVLMSTPNLANQHEALIRNLVHTLPIKDAYYADQVGWAIAEHKISLLYPLIDEIPIGSNTVRAIIQVGDPSLYPIAQKNINDAYDNWADVKNKDSYITLINFPEIMRLPGGQDIVTKFQEIEALKKIEDDIFNTMLKKPHPDKYKGIITSLSEIIKQPLSKQMDAQLGNILELVLHPDDDKDADAIAEIISLIIKKTKYKPNIAHVAKHTLEDEFDPLYEPLHEAIIANSDFYDLVLEILKNKRHELYKTVKAVAKQTDDKTLLKNIAASIRENSIEDLYPLVDEIAPETKKEEQVKLTLPQLFSWIVEYAQDLFSQVVTKLTFKN